MLPSRRAFLAGTSTALLGARASAADPVIDVHQHVPYAGRTADELVAHQRALGVSTTVLLPAGRPLQIPATHDGKSNGLQAGVGGFDEALALARRLPREFLLAANEVPVLPDAVTTIERQLAQGARMIAEQKFGVDCDSPDMQRIFALAAKHDVPVLIHFQHGMYNEGIDRLAAVLRRWRRVRFIGHAQTFWANVDKAYADPKDLYPKGPVTAGGLTDRLLSEHPNLYGDLSAGSGLNALTRDEAHARAFLDRHQDKLVFGSDCPDATPNTPKCTGSQTLAAVRRLAGSRRVERKILYENAHRVLRLRA
jgi:predicted TIM-barrel fold metal-dependent hydrolase